MNNHSAKTAKTYFWKNMPSPVGTLKLVASDAGLAAIMWDKDRPNRVKLEPQVENERHPVLLETEKQLQEYFNGKRKTFDVQLDFKGTDFQKNVWKALLSIPFGETRSYSEIAEQIGSKNAVRAVGAANGRNPIAIVAPCHRVIGMNGKLTGFAGGLAAKSFLLKVEGQTCGEDEVRNENLPLFSLK